MDNKNIKINSSALKIISSILFILLTLVLNGFLTFLEFKFDFSVIKTAEFWVLYAINISSATIIYILTYILRKLKNIKNDRIIGRIKEIFKHTDKIYKYNKVKASDKWLRDYYNEHLRIDKLEKKLRHKLSWFIPKEPRLINKRKLTQWTLIYYIYLLRKFISKIKEERRDKILKHLELLEIERDKLNNIKPNQETKEVLSKEFKAMIKRMRIREVTFKSLTANEFGYDNNRHETPFSNEKSNLLANLLWCLLIGMIITIIFYSIRDVSDKVLTEAEILILIVKAFTFLSYAVRGIFTADSYIFDKYVSVLDTRNDILIQLNGYLGLLDLPTESEKAEIVKQAIAEFEKKYEIE